jgi:hypothetical protein
MSKLEAPSASPTCEVDRLLAGSLARNSLLLDGKAPSSGMQPGAPSGPARELAGSQSGLAATSA